MKAKSMPDSKLCKRLHDALEPFPVLQYPFDLEALHDNGIYFFYEKGEVWGHNGAKPRIVRIGTSRDGNFKNRLMDHFLINRERWMDFGAMRPAPKDRSIFRKNIGRAIVNKEYPDYLDVWNIDFTTRKNRDMHHNLRDIELEKNIETKITEILKEQFSFRYIVLENQRERMGSGGLESRLIGTVSKCKYCKPSENWLGNHSPVDRIRESGLWLYQHLYGHGLTEEDINRFF